MIEDKEWPVGDKVWEFVHNHIPKLDILNYYPYGEKIEWEYWCTGKVNLRYAYKEHYNKNKTCEELIFYILTEIGRVMHYSIVNPEGICSHSQKLDAFSLWSLFISGISKWTKEPLKGLSKKEKEALYAYHDDRLDLLNGNGKYISAEQKAYHKKVKINEKLTKIYKKRKEHNRKTYGIYEVKYFPLASNTKRKIMFPLYSKKELSAIATMVSCYFENLC